MLRKPQKTHCGNTGRNGTQKTAFMQRSMSHAGGLSRNSDGRKAALLHSSREDMGAGEKAQGKGLCVMEMCITAYSVMENAIHSTWKSKVQLSHVLQTAFPTTPWARQLYTFPQRRAAAETPPLPHSFIYKNGGTYHQKRKHRVHGSCAHQRGAPPLYNWIPPRRSTYAAWGQPPRLAAFFIPRNHFPSRRKRQKARAIWHFLTAQ